MGPWCPRSQPPTHSHSSTGSYQHPLTIMDMATVGHTATVTKASQPQAKLGCPLGSTSPWQPPAPLARAEANSGVGKESLCWQMVCDAMPRSGPRPHWPCPGGWGRRVWRNLAEGSLGVHPSSADAPKGGTCPSNREWQGKGYRLTRKNNY